MAGGALVVTGGRVCGAQDSVNMCGTCMGRTPGSSDTEVSSGRTGTEVKRGCVSVRGG
jgi:hypothetical protein